MSKLDRSTEHGNWFEEWFNSPYYPLLYGNRNEEEAQQFVENMLDFLSPHPHARILDLACGHGRLARQLAARGYEVIGADISDTAISDARRHETARLSFVQHDMRQVFKRHYFDYIFNFFTSFGYFEHEQDHLDTLRAIREGLRDGGRFVLDYLNTVKVRRDLVANDSKQIGSVHFDLVRRFEDGHFVKDIAIQDGSREYRFQERVRGFMLNDFQYLFSCAGLKILHKFGDYRLGPYHEEESERLILIAVAG